MFTIKKKPLTPNIIWDGSAGRPLCNFGHKGSITTNDEDLAKKLSALGHEVTGEADAPAQSEDAAGEEAVQDSAEPVEPEVDPQAEQAAAPAAKEKGRRK